MRFLFIYCLSLIGLISCTKESTGDGAMASPKSGVITACYVEVNNNNILNTGSYTLEETGEQFFDLAIIFASNINFDPKTNKAILHHNENVQRVLDGRERYITPLQNRGIKVLLSILGNHQGVGVANFTNREDARDFAQQVADVVERYQLDGIDIDDEYAKYGEQGQPPANDSSWVMVLEEFRTIMPNKIISFYNIGPAASRMAWNDQQAGELLDYSWNPYYGQYNVPQIPEMTKMQLGPAAVWLGQTPRSTAISLAQRTVQEEYGVLLTYDLKNEDVSNYLSGISSALYGQETVLSGNLYSWP